MIMKVVVSLKQPPESRCAITCDHNVVFSPARKKSTEAYIYIYRLYDLISESIVMFFVQSLHSICII